MNSFSDLGLHAPILKALAQGDYNRPTPIQIQAIPHVAAGRDLLGIAQTGTGKTAAFALPILHRLMGDLAANNGKGERRRAPGRGCRALVLSPTRELASQIHERFRFYGRHLPLTSTVVFGGVGGGPQIRAMSKGVDVLIATPGRLLDHMSAGFIRLDHVETVVLDEADQMLDLGFLEPIKRIVAALPARRQSLFFSATMPKEIAGLAGKFLHNPVTVSVAPAATTVERVEQRAILIETGRKRELLVELLGDPAIARALVFTRTKHGADKVARHLEAARIDAAAIHGNKSQGQREKALADFKAGRARVLVATDIAARGIDVDGVTHVINFDLPNVPESYVHRIGRTARAGAAGIAISFCDREERAYLRDIEKLIRQTVPTTDRRIPGAPEEAAPKPRQHNGHRHGHRHGEHGRGGHGHGEHGHGGHGRGGHGHGEHGHGAHGHDGHGHGHGHGERAHGRGGRHQGGERRGGPGHGGKGHGPRAAADHRPQGLKPRPRFGLSHG